MVDLRVVVDQREKPSGVPSHLAKLGARVEFRVLDVGDYVMGDRVIERKSVSDFVSSLFSGRLFEQVARLTGSYSDSTLILEGDASEIVQGLSRPRAFWGALLSLTMEYGVRLFFTWDSTQTAELIYLYGRHMGYTRRQAIPHIVKKRRLGTDAEVQLAILENLPTIGPKLAEKLLRTFGTVRGIFCASQTELAIRGGIGRARARTISRLLDLKYELSLDDSQLKLRP